jgi:hypothetical protein
MVVAHELVSMILVGSMQSQMSLRGVVTPGHNHHTWTRRKLRISNVHYEVYL